MQHQTAPQVQMRRTILRLIQYVSSEVNVMELGGLGGCLHALWYVLHLTTHHLHNHKATPTEQASWSSGLGGKAILYRAIQL